MKLQPSALIDNEQYIVEVKNQNNEIKHVYVGKRVVNPKDKINEEGMYQSLWFVELSIVYVNSNIKLKIPSLKRSMRVDYSDYEHSLVLQSGKEFILDESNEEDEQITFYDYEFYNEYVLPKLQTSNMNIKASNSSENLLSSV